MLERLQWLLLILLVQVEELGGPDVLSRQPPACGRDGRDAAPGRLHPSHPDPQKVLAAVARFPREVRRLDATALDELFEA
jgi:hypothetical protein